MAAYFQSGGSLHAFESCPDSVSCVSSWRLPWWSAQGSRSPGEPAPLAICSFWIFLVFVFFFPSSQPLSLCWDSHLLGSEVLPYFLLLHSHSLTSALLTNQRWWKSIFTHHWYRNSNNHDNASIWIATSYLGTAVSSWIHSAQIRLPTGCPCHLVS